MIIIKEATTKSEANINRQKIIKKYLLVLESNIKLSVENAIEKTLGFVEKDSFKLFSDDLKDLKKENPDFDIAFFLKDYRKEEDSEYYKPIVDSLFISLSDNQNIIDSILLDIRKKYKI